MRQERPRQGHPLRVYLVTAACWVAALYTNVFRKLCFSSLDHRQVVKCHKRHVELKDWLQRRIEQNAVFAAEAKTMQFLNTLQSHKVASPLSRDVLGLSCLIYKDNDIVSGWRGCYYVNMPPSYDRVCKRWYNLGYNQHNLCVRRIKRLKLTLCGASSVTKYPNLASRGNFLNPGNWRATKDWKRRVNQLTALATNFSWKSWQSSGQGWCLNCHSNNKAEFKNNLISCA